jgi:hypothetical protein
VLPPAPLFFHSCLGGEKEEGSFRDIALPHKRHIPGLAKPGLKNKKKSAGFFFWGGGIVFIGFSKIHSCV